MGAQLKVIQCDGFHVFDLDDDATCDLCGVAKEEVVDIERYREEWRERLRWTDVNS